MTRRYLSETASGDFRALVVGQHQVHDSWDQIQAYLSSALSPSHAAIFAEPFRGQGAISWMASTDEEPKPFETLDAEEKELALVRLRSLLDDVSEVAGQLENGKTDQEQQWASLLQDIQRLPSGSELENMLFVAGDQPILTRWGMRDENSVEVSSVLRAHYEKPSEEIMARPFVARSGAAVLAPWAPLAWLLWLLFMLLVLFILWWLLFACAFGVPGSPDWLGKCRAQSELAMLQTEQDGLRQEYERLRTEASRVEPCQIGTAQLSPNGGGTDHEGSMSPRPELPGEETDIDRAREQAEGQVGDVTVTLIWNGHSDLDLHFVCPGGKRMFPNTQGTQQCGGVIDVDANRCSSRAGGLGTACMKYSSGPTEAPVENAFFNVADAPAGTFELKVRHFASAPSAPQAAVPYVVQLRIGEERTRFEGRAAAGQTDLVTTFSVNN